jgi:hypothetical protein
VQRAGVGSGAGRVRLSHHARVLRALTVVASVAALAALTGAPVAAKVAFVALADLTREAEFIGVARVTRVSFRIPLVLRRRATAVVLDGWKGRSEGRLAFGASPTWTCDISDAKDGEEIVAFIRDGRLLHSGHGRMPIFTRHGRRLAAIWPAVKLPPDLATEDGPDRELQFVRAVGVDDLRAAVGAVLSTAAVTSATVPGSQSAPAYVAR